MSKTFRCGEEGVALEDGVDRSPIRRNACDILAGDHDLALRRSLKAADEAECRCLATAARAEQREELASPQPEVDAVDSEHIAVELAHAHEFDHVVLATRRSRRPSGRREPALQRQLTMSTIVIVISVAHMSTAPIAFTVGVTVTRTRLRMTSGGCWWSRRGSRR